MKKILLILAIAILIISAVPVIGASQEPIMVEKGYWYSTNSTTLVAPGYSYVPLFVQFVSSVPVEITDVNVSLNYSSSPIFSYSYIHGPNREVRDYYTFPVLEPGQSETIAQLTNISALYPSGMYQATLQYSFLDNGVFVNGSSNFNVPVMGSVYIITQKAFFGTQTSPIEATSFMNNVPVTLYLENNGNSPVTNVSVSYTPQYPFSGNEQNYTISAFPAFYSLPLTFMVNTGMSPLTVKQNISISYSGISRVEKFTVSLSGYPYIVAAGSYFPAGAFVPAEGMNNIPLTFYIEDDSLIPATNISISYKPQYPLSGTPQETVISAIQSFGVQPITFMVNISGNEKNFTQSLTIFYNNTYHTISYSVILPGYSNITLVNYYTNPPYIFQDEKFIILNALIMNGGNAISGDENISLSSPYFNISTLPYNIPGIPPGKILNFTFLVTAPDRTGSLPLYLHVGTKVFDLAESVYSKGNMSLRTDVPAVSPGTDKNLFKFTLTNTGNVAIMDINIHILTPDVFYIDVPSSNPLGSLTANNITFSQLNPGQSIIITFLIDVRSTTAPGSYPSQIFISYRLNNSVIPFFNSYSFNVTVQNTVIQQFTSGSATPYIIIAFAVIIIMIFAAVLMRRKKKK